MDIYGSDYKCLEKLDFETYYMDTVTSTVRSDYVDMAGCNHARFVFHVSHKTTLDASHHLDITFEECATSGGVYTAVDSTRWFIPSKSSVTTQPLTAVGDIIFIVSPSLQYVKMVLTATGSPNADVEVFAERLSWEVKNV